MSCAKNDGCSGTDSPLRSVLDDFSRTQGDLEAVQVHFGIYCSIRGVRNVYCACDLVVSPVAFKLYPSWRLPISFCRGWYVCLDIECLSLACILIYRCLLPPSRPFTMSLGFPMLLLSWKDRSPCFNETVACSDSNASDRNLDTTW